MTGHGPFFLSVSNVSCAAASIFISVCALAFTPANARWVRLVVGSSSFALALLALSLTNRSSHEGQSFAEALCAICMHCFNRLVFDADDAEVPPAVVAKGTWARFKWALAQGMSLRRTRPKLISGDAQTMVSTDVKGSPATATATGKANGSVKGNARQRKGTPAASKKNVEATAVTPQGATDTVYQATADAPFNPYWRVIRLCKGLLFLSAFYYLRSHSLLPWVVPTYNDFLPQPLFVRALLDHNLALRTVLLRADIVGVSLLMPSLMLCAAHNVLSAIFGNNKEGPAAWPPIYGSITHGYSMGMWYARVWHTLMRRAFTLPARLCATKILRLKPHSPLGRAVIILLAFGISGIMHTFTSWSPGPCERLSWAELWFHLLTGCAVIGERVVIEGYLALRKEVLGSKELSIVESVLFRSIGYLWVAFWWMEVFGAGVLYPWIVCRARAAAYGNAK